MKKLGFVTPWYGENIPGGAEMELRGLVHHLHDAGVPVEILTTCVKEFVSDWNVNYYKEGVSVEAGIQVRRFKVRKRDTQAFDRVNLKLMNNLSLTDEEEQIFIREMINSPDLYRYMKAHQEEYSLFILIPYMFGPVYYGAVTCPEKAVLIPCFHDEAYLYLNIFREAFSKVKGIMYNAEPERELTNRVYDLSQVQQTVIGVGVDTELSFDAERFREKFGITDPFILYAGRKDVGKNIYALIRYFAEYKKRTVGSSLKLVLLGGGEVVIPQEIKRDVYDLGFVDIQDKYDAYAAAELLCQPSMHESFSLVVMESWLCGRPVLVHEGCEVTKHFVSSSNGGLYFRNYFEFEGCVNYMLAQPEISSAMGRLGRQFVLDNFSWDVVVARVMGFLEGILETQNKCLQNQVI